MPLDKNTAKVGMKVQDGSANEGTIRWIGKLEKKHKPPNKDTGTYCAVEFEPNGALHRFNGTWAGEKFFEAPEGSCEWVKPDKLFQPMCERAVKDLRNYYKARIDHMSDTVLIKFCVARKFDMPKVVEMMNKHILWEKEYQPTWDIFFPRGMADFYPVGFGEGLDREGNILYFERPGNGGKYDPSKFVSTFGIEKISQWHVAVMEEGRKRLREHPTAKRVTVIVDLLKLGDCDMSVVKFGKAIGAIDQDHYPEHLCKLFMINASGMFTGVWKMLRVFIDDRTKQKIQILGSKYEEELKAQIPEEYIPDFAGGTNTSWMNAGGHAGSPDPDHQAEAKAAFKEEDVSTPTEADAAKAEAETPVEAGSPASPASPQQETPTSE